VSKRISLSFPAKTIGLDLGDRVSIFTVRGPDGRVCCRGKLATTKERFREFFAAEQGTRVIYEVGTHSPWITALLRNLGCETVVANPWRVKLIAKSLDKCDRKDADLLSEFGFLKPSVLSPVTHRAPETASARAVITARAALVRMRTQAINTVRGLVKSIGHRLPTCTADSFHNKVWIPDELAAALLPLRDLIADLTRRIARFDRQIEQLCRDAYPETKRLRQVRGVGPITSLAFVLTIEDPKRFRCSREVGSYLGLVPKVAQSSGDSPELRITKAGDRSLRTLLVQCAQYVCGRFGEDSDLRRFGHAIAARGGKTAKKRAVVAVARKLAVLLHALWVTDQPYEPLKNTKIALQQAS
jgi:transposase